MRLFTADLNGWVHPADVFVTLFENEENSFWFDRETNLDQPFSVLGASNRLISDAESFDIRTEFALDDSQAEDCQLPFEFRPGLVGLVAYEGEGKFMLVDRAIVFDHVAKNVHLIGYFESAADFEFWRKAAFLRLWLCGGRQAAYSFSQNHRTTPCQARVLINANDYLQKIIQAQKHIAAGDIYQICLTNRIFVETEADPLVTFLNLRVSNAAPYSSYLKLGDLHVVSSSPEQFLKVTATGRLQSKPIKGTRRRGKTELEDAQIAAELQQNEKERAENLMIVDLMRNDLGRVSKSESVSVSKLFDVESYATVHQLVSTIEADLAENESAASALRAAFPGGSMTGAPKIRAMQLIREFEGEARGVYSGVIGSFGADGSADFAMTIRTIVFEAGRASIGVGGGITSDSDPEAELEETKLKAKALLQVLSASDPWA